ncbi:MAG: zinc ribbon domain-containing protein [Deltaproteobacteria bacterium]|nr:zinc ribbon domain-containing protein [Deltaproteobacteria bacterium]MBW2139904.1 zinc ribbon domain-containing protein [Deltaproteobacteria bacterium]
MKKDPLLQKVADNLKETVQSFAEGYRERQDQPKHCQKCEKPVSSKDNFCPHCGTKLE